MSFLILQNRVFDKFRFFSLFKKSELCGRSLAAIALCFVVAGFIDACTN